MAAFNNLFGPNMWGSIAANPQLAPFLAQPDYVQKLKEIQQDPGKINQYMNDPRIMNTMMGLLGLNSKMSEFDAKEQVRPTFS
jgi:stress-induced-phosphoprotein 1